MKPSNDVAGKRVFLIANDTSLNGETHGIADDYDGEILRIARELCAKIGKADVSIEAIEWASSIYTGRLPETVYSDQPSLRWAIRWSEGRPRMSMTLVLPKQIRKKLEPEEWKPLLASFFVYHKSKDVNRRVSALALVLIISLIATLGTLFFVIYNGVLDGLVAILTGVTTLVLVFVPGLYFLNQLDQRAKLRADMIAADLVGKENLVRVLKKVDSLRLADVENLKKGGLRSRLTGRPSISKRIESLMSI